MESFDCLEGCKGDEDLNGRQVHSKNLIQADMIDVNIFKQAQQPFQTHFFFMAKQEWLTQFFSTQSKATTKSEKTYYSICVLHRQICPSSMLLAACVV